MIELGFVQNCVSIYAGFWNTTDMQAGEEREVIVRTTLRELAVYLVFLAILCVGELLVYFVL